MDQKLYATNAAFVPLLSQKLMALASLEAHESVLDFGCGDGVLTKQIQETQVSGRVVGIDNQEDMIAAARRLGIVDARLVSAQNLRDEADLQKNEFDVVITNAVLHWIPDLANMDDPYILKAIAKALKPTGRFVGEFGAFQNINEIVSTICLSLIHHGVSPTTIRNDIMPFFFPTDKAWTSILENAGFKVEFVESEARLTLLPGKVSAWAETFLERYVSCRLMIDKKIERQSLIRDRFLVYAGDKREAVLRDLDTVMEITNMDEQGRYYAGYRRIRFVATIR